MVSSCSSIVAFPFFTRQRQRGEGFPSCLDLDIVTSSKDSCFHKLLMRRIRPALGLGQICAHQKGVSSHRAIVGGEGWGPSPFLPPRDRGAGKWLDEHQEDPDERHGLDSYIELAGQKPLEASRRTVVIRNKRDFADTETNNQDRKGSGVYGSFSYAPKIFVSKLQQVPSVQFQKRAPDSELPELDEHQEDPDERHGLDSYNEWGGHKPLEASRSTVVIRNKRDFAETETNNQDGKGVTTEHTGPAPTMAEEIGSPGPPTPSKLLQRMRISKRDGDRPAKDR